MLRWLALLPLLVLAAGCGEGKSRAPVAGKVTIAGKPPGVTGVTISFVGEDNQAVTAEVGADGAYQASGVLTGANKVSLGFNAGSGATAPIEGNLTSEQVEAMKKQQEAERLKGLKAAKANPVPPRYNDPSTSQLTFAVEKKDNTYNVDLKK